MQETQPVTTAFSIHPATHMGTVTLRVADLDRSLAFYAQVVGLHPLTRTATSATLGGTEGLPLLTLHAVPGLAPSPERATGLYHFAIVLPSRPDLGRALARLAAAEIPVGQADHLVSEALYISDPDHHGIEIYWDRPRDTWSYANGAVRMATDPLDLRAILAEGADLTWDAVPAGTRMGHVHLKVGDIPQAQHFYHDILGFDLMATMPSALFVSAGGYHHHLGMNIWHSRGASPSPATAASLQSFEVVLPDAEALAQVTARLAAHGIATQPGRDFVAVDDPWHNTLLLVVRQG